MHKSYTLNRAVIERPVILADSYMAASSGHQGMVLPCPACSRLGPAHILGLCVLTCMPELSKVLVQASTWMHGLSGEALLRHWIVEKGSGFIHPALTYTESPAGNGRCATSWLCLLAASLRGAFRSISTSGGHGLCPHPPGLLRMQRLGSNGGHPFKSVSEFPLMVLPYGSAQMHALSGADAWNVFCDMDFADEPSPAVRAKYRVQSAQMIDSRESGDSI